MDELTRRIWNEVEPHIEEQGFELVEVLLGRSGRRTVLRIFIDKPAGVTLDDCAAVSQLLGPILDAEDFFSGSYLLEVSSPGFDRPLRKAKDFERFAGETVRLRAATPVNGRRNFRGALLGYRDGLILLDCDGTPFELHIGNLDRAHLVR